MAGGFKKLKQLGLDKFDELRFVEIQKGAMSGIEKLSIQRCKWLQKVPLGIEHLTELKVLEFFDMPMKKVKTIGELHTFLKCIQPIGETGGWALYSLESFSEGESASLHNTITSNSDNSHGVAQSFLKIHFHC